MKKTENKYQKQLDDIERRRAEFEAMREKKKAYVTREPFRKCNIRAIMVPNGRDSKQSN